MKYGLVLVCAVGLSALAPAQSIQLPDFCDASLVAVNHGSCPTGTAQAVQATNARSIAAQLSTDANTYTLVAQSGVQIVATCKATCPANDPKLVAIQNQVRAKALPNSRILATPGSATATAQTLNSDFGQDVVATALPSGDQVELAGFNIATINSAAMSLVPSAALLPINLDSFCISTTLDGHPPLPAPAICGPGDMRVQAANASDIQTAVASLAKTLNISVTAQGNSKLILACTKQTCLQADMAQLRTVITGMASVSPAFIQDVDLSADSASGAAKDITALKFKGITVDQLGTNKIRLKSDVRVSRQEVDALVSQYLFGNHAPPEFRMFYQDGPSVVTALTPPAGSSSTGGGTGGAAPATGTANPPANTAGSTPSASGTPGASNPSAISFAVKTDTSTSAPPAKTTTTTAAAGAPAVPSKDSSSPSTSTSTTTTITPPAAPAAQAPAAAPAPTPIGKNMQAFSDNVVFTDTSNDQTVWQQVRLLTLLDLPRPEVLLNVWSYQASSPDGRDIEARAEKVRDLVSGQNQTLENSIQFGWTFLSHQMSLDRLHQDVADSLPRQPAATTEMPLPNLPQNLAATAGFFNHDFYDYITQKYVSDPPGSLSSSDRNKWGFCPVGKFCLGFTHAFQPLKPNLTSILLGAIASNRPLFTILKTIGCMEGKYEVYSDCFPERDKLLQAVHVSDADVMQKLKSKSKSKSTVGLDINVKCPDCKAQMDKAKLELDDLEKDCPGCFNDLSKDLAALKVKCPDCQLELLHAQSTLRDLDAAYSERYARLQEMDKAYGVLHSMGCPATQGILAHAQTFSANIRQFSDRYSFFFSDLRSLSAEVKQGIDQYTDGLGQVETLETLLGFIRDCPNCKIEETLSTLRGIGIAYREHLSRLQNLSALLEGLVATFPDYQYTADLFRFLAYSEGLEKLTSCQIKIDTFGSELEVIEKAQPAPVVKLKDLEATLSALKPLCPSCQNQNVFTELQSLRLTCPDWKKELENIQNNMLSGEGCKDCEKLKADLTKLEDECPGCQQQLESILKKYASTLREQSDARLKLQELMAECPSCLQYLTEVEGKRTCLRTERHKLLHDDPLYRDRLSCQVLDEVALKAEESCHIAQTFPLSCFTIQATQSFSLTNTYSTFTLEQLNELAEEPLATLPIVDRADSSQNYGTTRVGLMRAAVADFLFNYKMSQEYPREFSPYELQHSAQELNAELNPLVVAFNEDVAAFSRHLSDHLDPPVTGQLLFSHLWASHKSFLSDGLITVRGIGGIKSIVSTATQNYFDATQAPSLSSILNTLTGQSSTGGTPSSPLAALEKGSVNPTTAIAALAALTPTPTQAKIGRQLNFTVTPHTLPGASSAELDVQLQADETADPSLYQGGKATGASDTLSRVANHDVTTRIRVESVKLFELSSFSALLQRPRSKFPLLPPFIELPLIGSIASLPLPGLKEYHRSTAIVSAIIVPTATDLAYGIDFVHDRIITPADTTVWDHRYEMRSAYSLSQFTRTPIRAFHNAIVNCLATNGGLIAPGGMRILSSSQPALRPTCSAIDFRTVPPEF